MNDLLMGWMARLPALFGQCKRCTRSSMVAAVCAWAAAFLSLVLLRRLDITAGLFLLAIGLTGLWLAHLAALAARGTLSGMLRELGAKPHEAKAIIGALDLAAAPGARSQGRLQEGEALSVRRVERPDGAGHKLTRVVITNEQGVLAAAGLAADGTYRRLDPESVEASA